MDKKDTEQLVRRAYLSILPAQLLSSLIPFLSGIISGLVIGNSYSANTIAIIGFVSIFNYLLYAIRACFSIGGTMTAGNFMGQGKLDKVSEAFNMGVKMLTLIGCVFTVCILAFPKIAICFLSIDKSLMGATVSYLRGLANGIIPSLLIPFLTGFLQLAGDSKRVVFSSGLNAGLNLVLALVAVNLLKMDVFGIGLANSIASLIVAIYLIIALKRTGFINLSAHAKDYSIIKKIIYHGSSSGLLLLMETLRNTVLISRVLIVGGIPASAATAILFSASGMLDFITVGFMGTVSAVGSLYAGQENELALEKVARWGVRVGGIAGLISGALFIIFAKQISLFFGSASIVLDLSVSCLRMYGAFFLIVNPFQVILCMYQCLKRVKTNIAILFIKEVVVSISAIFILGNIFGIKGIWSVFFVSTVFGIVLVVGLSIYKCKKQGRKKFSLIWFEEKDNFTSSENFYLFDENDMAETLQGVELFCKDNQLSKRNSKVCRLLTEENVSILLEHGIAFRKKVLLTISVFIGTDGEKTRMIFADNSASFEPLKRFPIYYEDSNSMIRDASIRIIESMAKDISYQFSLGMNILVIDIYE